MRQEKPHLFFIHLLRFLAFSDFSASRRHHSVSASYFGEGIDLKTVYRFQRVATRRAQSHHQQVVQDVDVPGVQLDEAHSKLRPKQVEWVHTALAMGSWFLLWVDFGPRTQDTAAALIAQVIARARQLPLFLTDGWKAYTAALLQVVGIVYRPRRRGHVGRKPKPRLVAPKTLF
jgi:hypothetical protein